MTSIVIIGSRGAGKTTYLAGLSYWEKLKISQGRKSIFTVEPLNETAKQLRTKAENILLQGASLEPTQVPTGGVFDLPVYSFALTVNRGISGIDNINLIVRDYAGEIFDELSYGFKSPEREDFFKDCLRRDVKGCLILLTQWEKQDDIFYSRTIGVFNYLMALHNRSMDYRVAVAVSKCERGEVWPVRINPSTDLFANSLPMTKAILQRNIPPKNLQFYAVSTFGVLGRNDPRPNRIDELGTKNSILRHPSVWQPYNMIAPLYWLSTGKRINSNV